MSENNGQPVVEKPGDEGFLDSAPSALKTFIKEYQIPVGERFSTALYRIGKTDPKQLKPRKVWLEKRENGLYLEAEGFGEEYISETHGGGEYQAITTFKKGNGKRGMEWDIYYISGEPKTPHLDTTKIISDNAGSSNQKPEPGSPSILPGSGTPALNPDSILKWVAAITPLLTVLKDLIPKPDYTLINKIAETQIESKKSFDRKVEALELSLMKRQMERAEESLHKEESEEPVNTEKGFIIPEWLEQFAPLLEKFGEKLLKKNPIGNFLRAELVKTDKFQECWKDPEKRAEATEAFAQYLGRDAAISLNAQFTEMMNA